MDGLTLLPFLIAPAALMLLVTRPLARMPVLRDRPRLGLALWLLPGLCWLGWVAIFLRDTARDPTSHNLWPLAMVAFAFYWLCYAGALQVVLRLAGWIRSRRDARG